jgi:hypothetical protein
MQLQQFVTKIIEELGGLVEPIEYSLCNVLIPEGYISYFQNKSEIILAFDFEVAQENPDAEFVTFGSYVLEQLLLIVQEKAVSTLRFAEVERLELGNPLKKLTDYLQDESGKINIVDERPVFGVWAVFQYRITYVSDEKIETSDQVWINLLTNKISSTMKEEQNRIIYKHESLYTYPISVQIDLSMPLKVATNYVKQQAEQQNHPDTKSVAYEKDTIRITNYYTELLKENEKRVSRPGLSDEKKKEITTKSAAIELERDKQLQEIHNKYNGQTEIALDNGILYFIPLLEFTINIEFRGNIKRKIIYFNPITKQFFEGTL